MLLVAAALAAETVTLHWDPEARGPDTWRCVTLHAEHRIDGDPVRVRVETQARRTVERQGDAWVLEPGEHTLLAVTQEPPPREGAWSPLVVNARGPDVQPRALVDAEGRWKGAEPLSEEAWRARLAPLFQGAGLPEEHRARGFAVFERSYAPERFLRLSEQRWYAVLGHWIGRRVRIGASGQSARPTYPFPDVTRASWSVAPAECDGAPRCVALTFTVVAPPPYATMTPQEHSHFRYAHAPEAHEVRLSQTLSWTRVVDPDTLVAWRTEEREVLEATVRHHGAPTRSFVERTTECLPAP